MLSPSAHPASGASSRPIILLVEDHDGYRRIVRQALECFLPGWTLREADCLRSAAEMLRDGGARVLVCDLMLPDGTAADLVDQLPSMKCDETKVIVFSNHSAEALEPLLARPQVHGYLMKERGLRELAVMIEQAANAGGPYPAAVAVN